ncbi:MAG: SOS response-associated peptidase [Pseudomonadota bacterium]
MVTRYILDKGAARVEAHYNALLPEAFPPRYNIAPSQPVPVIRAGREGSRECVLMRWGFVPGWDRQGTWFKNAVVNIRSETAPSKASFRGAWARRRCLFPVTGFYEWLPSSGAAVGQAKNSSGSGSKKQPYLLVLSEEKPLFSIAGLWEHWMSEDGSEMETAATLSQVPSGTIAHFHHRSPVIVPPERYQDWLHADERDGGLLREIVRTPAPDFVFWPVHPRVNSWKETGAHLIEPIPLEKANESSQGELF